MITNQPKLETLKSDCFSLRSNLLFWKRIFMFLFFLSIIFLQQTFAQNHSVTGTVTDSDGNPLVGANVTIKNSIIGVLTDASGKYSINAPNASAILVFTSVGFATREEPINNRLTINLSLAPNVQELEKVVVVGYGVQQKKTLTGAVSTIGEQQLRAVPVGDAASRLQGRVSGVTVTNNNSLGGAATVRVRGYGSLGNNNPLFVIDGIPRTSMDNINPNDIESMTVLKDASSSWKFR